MCEGRKEDGEQARRSRDQELGIAPSVLFEGDRGGELGVGGKGEDMEHGVSLSLNCRGNW